ncbi:MAG: hypothetical protein ABSD63_06635 [Candidatus Korobacteraceae bacterium]
MKKTSIYLVCFHSETQNLNGSRSQFATVERAIKNQEWPYDNGDDPSFYVARRRGRLTWGVCRQDLRNSLPKNSVVVFFSFTSMSKDRFVYRLCAVATVDDKVDHRAVYRNAILRGKRYINVLIRPEKGGWRYDETDRPRPGRHSDWLWRIADHRGFTGKVFKSRYRKVYEDEWFSERTLKTRDLKLGNNYIVFSGLTGRTFISAKPPIVATAKKGKHEVWNNAELKRLTVDTASQLLKSQRDYLRVVNSSGRNVHRQIRFEMESDEVTRWRASLISALKHAASVGAIGIQASSDGVARVVRCG